MSRPSHTRHYLRIGQIAARSGVSAKALRLYEQRGLLQPCAHSATGYRLYGPEALRRLMQIVMLKRSGFTLAQIAGLQASGTSVVAALLGERIQSLRREVADKTQTLATLYLLSERMDSTSNVDLNQLLESLTMTQQLDTTIDKRQRDEILARAEQFNILHTSDEQARLRERVERQLTELGADGVEAAQRPWRELSAQVRAAMAAGTPADDPSLSALVAQWQEFIESLTANDPDLLTKLRDAYTRHPELMHAQSMSPAMMDFMAAAVDATSQR